MLTVSDLRIHDNRKTVVTYFLCRDGLFVLRTRGDDILNIPYTLNNVAILFENNICLMNDGITVKPCFPLLRSAIDLNKLSGILNHTTEILPHEFVRNLPFEEGARGVHMLLSFHPRVVVIFNMNCNKRIYINSFSDVSYYLQTFISSYGAIKNIVFDRGNFNVRAQS